jgi:uncharacterized membrane protein YbhN (UPF0104 family)
MAPCTTSGRRLIVKRPAPYLKAALSAGVLGVIIWRIPFAGLRAAFRDLEYVSLLVAICCFLLLLFLRAYKWHRLLAAVGKVHLRQSLRTLFGGFALGLMTPGRLGELARCVFVREEERPQVTLLTLLDRMLDLWALVTLMGASLFFQGPLPAAIFGAVVCLALLPLMMSIPNILTYLFKLARKSRRFHGHFTGVATGLRQAQIPRFALLALGAMGVELLSFFFLLGAFFPTPFATAAATYPYIVLAGDLPVSFSGMGVREGAAALLLSSYSVPSSAAVDATLLWFVFAILLPAALGCIWLVVERMRPRARHSDVKSHRHERLWKPSVPPLGCHPAAPPSEAVGILPGSP